jgi:predicted DNA-binding antitoxin AbrB/MazE fold protein
MTTTVEAIYENGTLKLPRPLPLAEKAQVVVTIQTKTEYNESDEREAWLKKSELNLIKAWDNPADDVFNELLDKYVEKERHWHELSAEAEADRRSGKLDRLPEIIHKARAEIREGCSSSN